MSVNCYTGREISRGEIIIHSRSDDSTPTGAGIARRDIACADVVAAQSEAQIRSRTGAPVSFLEVLHDWGHVEMCRGIALVEHTATRPTILHKSREFAPAAEVHALLKDAG